MLIIPSPAQLNDWKTRKTLFIILSVCLGIWGVVGLNSIGIQTPILRQLLGFVYITFLPGILIVRILKLHNMGNIETILYIVGLSISFLMFIGSFINAVYPAIGILRPISFAPLMVTITISILIFCLICSIVDRNIASPRLIQIDGFFSPFALCLYLIPFISLFGTYLMNHYGNNVLLISLLLLIAISFVYINYVKFTSDDIYPLAIFMTSISLLYYASQVSTHITGWDIQIEYFLCNLVTTNGIWNPIIVGDINIQNCNTMLSLVILAPTYSIISASDITFVFKSIYPLIFSLVPIGLYKIFCKQTNKNIAFLATIFFMSIDIFYIPRPRQNIAELFLMLLILVIVDEDIDNVRKALLSLAFSASLIVSHYGTSYLYMLAIICYWPISFFLDKINFRKILLKNEAIFPNFIPHFSSIYRANGSLNSMYILLFIVMALAWYIFISVSSPFITIVIIINQITSNVWSEFLSPTFSEGLSIIMMNATSQLHIIFKYMHLLTLFFIFVGICVSLLKRDYIMKFSKGYLILSLIFFIICVAGIVLPFFSGAMSTQRLYHISLIFLSLFCIIGGMTIIQTIMNVSVAMRILSIFFAIFFLFNTGWVYEILDDDPSSFYLNNSIDGPHFSDQEVTAAKWLTNEKGNSFVLADEYRWLLLLGFLQSDNIRTFSEKIGDMPQFAYVFLGKLNVQTRNILIQPGKKISLTKEYIKYYPALDRDKLYSNGGSEVYY